MQKIFYLDVSLLEELLADAASRDVFQLEFDFLHLNWVSRHRIWLVEYVQYVLFVFHELLEELINDIFSEQRLVRKGQVRTNADELQSD